MENEIQILVEAAEQLQALKATLAEQQGSSVRLRGLADALERVGAQIAKVPAGLSAVVEKAEAVERRVLAAANKVEALRDGIPAVIERIEKSDVGKSIDALTSDISGSRNDLKAFRDSLSQITSVVEEFRNANQTVFAEIKSVLGRTVTAQEQVNSAVQAIRDEMLAKLDGIERRIVSTEDSSEKSTATTLKAFQVIAATVKDAGIQQSTALQQLQRKIEDLKTLELAEIRQALQAISEQIHQQGASLDVVAKKKGFSF